MPLLFTNRTRRSFLSAAMTAGAAGVLRLHAETGLTSNSDSLDPDYWVLISDTHIDQDPNRIYMDINSSDMLHEVVARVLAQEVLPAGIIINGDAANVEGLPGEYGLFAWHIRPLIQRGIPVYVTMGNHDRRPASTKMLHTMQPTDYPVEDRRVAVIDTPTTRMILLDTLLPGKVSGGLGEPQMEWLRGQLTAVEGDKPILLFAHHTPGADGIADYDEFIELARGDKRVKAYIFGHSHRWGLGEEDGFHFINQPTTAHVFDKSQTQAYLHAHLKKDGLSLKMECLNKADSRHGKTFDLAYR